MIVRLKKTTLILASLSIASLITACGNSGIAGVEGTGGSQQGGVSGFGSVIVNGVAINTDNAEFIINGNPGTENDVKVGHTVAIETFSNGDARRVVVDRRVDGPLDSVDIAAGTATALSQPIRVTATTRYENTDFSRDDASPRGVLNPADSDLVAVSGFVDADNVLVATLFRRASQTYEREINVFDVDGTVSELDSNLQEFSLGDLTVDYSAANVSGELSNGLNVEAIGMQPEKGGKLEASQIIIKPASTDSAGDNIAFTGFVTEALSENRFVIDGIEIDTSEATRQDNSDETVSRNSLVSVSGTLLENGGVIANQFTVTPFSSVTYTGTTDIGDSNEPKVYGIAALLSSSTAYQDNSSRALRQFNSERIAAGDKLSIVGYYDRDDRLTATVVERLPSDHIDSVRGPLETCSSVSNTLTIGNVAVTVSSATNYQNQQGEAFTSKDEFCIAAADQTATAFGNQSDDSLTASRVVISR